MYLCWSTGLSIWTEHKVKKTKSYIVETSLALRHVCWCSSLCRYSALQISTGWSVIWVPQSSSGFIRKQKISFLQLTFLLLFLMPFSFYVEDSLLICMELQQRLHRGSEPAGCWVIPVVFCSIPKPAGICALWVLSTGSGKAQSDKEIGPTR